MLVPAGVLQDSTVEDRYQTEIDFARVMNVMASNGVGDFELNQMFEERSTSQDSVDGFSNAVMIASEETGISHFDIIMFIAKRYTDLEKSSNLSLLLRVMNEEIINSIRRDMSHMCGILVDVFDESVLSVLVEDE
jgi:nitrogen regulatory protein PII-like uncharacterized protein